MIELNASGPGLTPDEPWWQAGEHQVSLLAQLLHARRVRAPTACRTVKRLAHSNFVQTNIGVPASRQLQRASLQRASGQLGLFADDVGNSPWLLRHLSAARWSAR